MVTKEFVSEIDSYLTCMAGCVDLIFKSFQNGNKNTLEDAKCAIEEFPSRSADITSMVLSALESDPLAGRYAMAPAHLERIGEGVERIGRAVGRMIKEDAIFSDLALKEGAYMFERLRDVIVHMRDLIDTTSPLTAHHIVQTARTMEHSAEEFASRHEDRLIGGLCLPKASGIYLDMLGSLRDIAWHAREIARDFEK